MPDDNEDDDLNPTIIDDLNSALFKTFQDNGLVVESYVGFVRYINQDGTQCFFSLSPDTQAQHVTMSLADELRSWHEEVRRVGQQSEIYSWYD